MALSTYNTKSVGFDAQCFSTFTHESEVVFFGGHTILQIIRIFKIKDGKQMTFKNEIKAIRTIRALAIGAPPDLTISQNTKALTVTMLQSVLDGTVEDAVTSQYIRKLLMYQIENAPSRVEYDFEILFRDFRFLTGIVVKRREMEPLLCIDTLFNLFARRRHIVCMMPDSYETRAVFWNSVIDDMLRVEKAATLAFQWRDVHDGPGKRMSLLCWESLNQHKDRFGELKVTHADNRVIISRQGPLEMGDMLKGIKSIRGSAVDKVLLSLLIPHCTWLMWTHLLCD